MNQAFIDYIRADSNRYYMLEPEEQELFTRQRDFETKLELHPAARGRGTSDPTDPGEQLWNVRVAKTGLKFVKAKRSRDEMDDLTSKFRRLSVNDQNVMNVVRRSIFRTDR